MGTALRMCAAARWSCGLRWRLALSRGTAAGCSTLPMLTPKVASAAWSIQAAARWVVLGGALVRGPARGRDRGPGGSSLEAGESGLGQARAKVATGVDPGAVAAVAPGSRLVAPPGGFANFRRIPVAMRSIGSQRSGREAAETLAARLLGPDTEWVVWLCQGFHCREILGA